MGKLDKDADAVMDEVSRLRDNMKERIAGLPVQSGDSSVFVDELKKFIEDTHMNGDELSYINDEDSFLLFRLRSGSTKPSGKRRE